MSDVFRDPSKVVVTGKEEEEEAELKSILKDVEQLGELSLYAQVTRLLANLEGTWSLNVFFMSGASQMSWKERKNWEERKLIAAGGKVCVVRFVFRLCWL